MNLGSLTISKKSLFCYPCKHYAFISLEANLKKKKLFSFNFKLKQNNNDKRAKTFIWKPF